MSLNSSLKRVLAAVAFSMAAMAAALTTTAQPTITSFSPSSGAIRSTPNIVSVKVEARVDCELALGISFYESHNQLGSEN